MKIIKLLVLIRAFWEIEPCIFVASFLIMFTTVVYYFQPTKGRHIFLNNMESIRIISRKEIWLIRRDGKSINIIYRGYRDGIWEQIWGILGSLMQARSIINGDGRYIQIWATKLHLPLKHHDNIGGSHL